MMMKRFFTTMLILLVAISGLGLISCSKNDSPEPDNNKWKPRPPKEVADQTVIFLLSGQSLLSYFRDTNVEEIRQAIDEYILYDSRLLVYIQPAKNQSLLIEYSFDYDKQLSRADTLKRYYNSRSIDATHIVEVINDAAKLAPAQKYGMVLGSHGGGWVDKDNLNLQRSESSTYMIDDGDVDLLHKSEGADPTRWFGEDYSQTNTRETANISTWAAAFEYADVDFEYLIFDACFMSNIEALYELRNSAKYIVASPCEIMARGMPYYNALRYLFVNEGKDYDLNGFCREYCDFYSTVTTTRQSGCIALTVCSEIEQLADITKRINASSPRGYDPAMLQTYEGLYPHLFFDFGQYIERICTDSSLLEEFNEQFDRCFPEGSRLHTAGFYSGYNNSMNAIKYYSGVTTSAPSTKYPTTYQKTKWVEATQP